MVRTARRMYSNQIIVSVIEAKGFLLFVILIFDFILFYVFPFLPVFLIMRCSLSYRAGAESRDIISAFVRWETGMSREFVCSLVRSSPGEPVDKIRLDHTLYFLTLGSVGKGTGSSNGTRFSDPDGQVFQEACQS